VITPATTRSTAHTTPAPGPLVVIPCGGKKADRTLPAHQLYVGSYFRACLNAALAITPAHRVRVLSARHGLLPLEQLIAPYELRMGQPGAVSVERVTQQARDQGLHDEAAVLVLAGRAYAALVRQVWPHAVDAFAGTAGIGEQLARLAAYRQDPDSARALLPGPPTLSDPAQPPAAPQAPAWRYVEDPDSLLAHAVPTHRRTGERTMCGRAVTFSPATTRRTAQGHRQDAMVALDPQPWPTCTGCRRAMPPGAREVERARHARWEADQLAHTVDDLEADDDALLVPGELWEPGDVVTFAPPASADKPTRGAAGRAEVLEVLEEDDRYLTGSQYLVRHLRSSRLAYATDDELLDVLAGAAIPAC